MALIQVPRELTFGSPSQNLGYEKLSRWRSWSFDRARGARRGSASGRPGNCGPCTSQSCSPAAPQAARARTSGGAPGLGARGVDPDTASGITVLLGWLLASVAGLTARPRPPGRGTVRQVRGVRAVELGAVRR